MKIIITKRQLNLINEQAGISKSEQRAQNAYKLMIDGSSGWGSKPNLIVQGINSLTKYDESLSSLLFLIYSFLPKFNF